MLTGLPPIVAHLVGDISGFAASMGEADALAAKASGSATASWGAAGKQMMAVGGAIAAAAGAVAFETIRSAVAFDRQMELVHTQAGASQAEVEALKQKVLDLAAATGQGPEKLAEALFHVESVGYRGATAMAVLTNAAKLAEVSGANLDDVTYGLTSVMQTFGARADEASKYAALFNATVGAGDMRMQDFARAVGTGFYATGQTFGVTAQSMSAALAFMTDRGSRADESATRLRMSIALMAAPSSKATGILQSLGLTAHEAATQQQIAAGILTKSGITYSRLADDLRKPDGFYVALLDLKKALEASGLSADAANAQISHAFGGGRSDAAILSMLNNLGTLQQKYDAVGKGMGSFGEAVSAAAKTPAVQWQQFVATVQALGIEIGQDLLPSAMSMLAWLKQAATWAEQNSSVVRVLAEVIGGALVVGLAAATAGAIAFAASTIEVWGPVLLIIAAITLLVVAVVYLWTHWQQIWGWIVDHAKAVGGAIAGWFSRTWATMRTDATNGWNAVVGAIQRAWSAITSWVSSAWHAVTDPIVNGWHWLSDTTIRVWTAIHDWFAKWWPLLLLIFAPYIAVVVGLWNHFHAQVWSTVQSVWTTVTKWLAATWAVVVATAKAQWALFQKWIVSPIEGAYHDVVSWLGSMVNWVRQWLSGAVGVVRAVWSTVTAVFVDPVISAYHQIVSWCDSLFNWVTGTFSNLYGWISNQWNGWWNLGWNLVSGFINGIESQWGNLQNVVGNMANGALSWAKNILGIHSPSRVFADEVGKMIPAGVGVGVTANTSAATSSLTALGAKMAQVARVSVSPSVSMGSMTPMLTASLRTGSQQVIYVNLTSTAQVDGKTLFTTQQTQALQYRQRNGVPAFS